MTKLGQKKGQTLENISCKEGKHRNATITVDHREGSYIIINQDKASAGDALAFLEVCFYLRHSS